jgi:hypothetical protein
MRQARGFSHYPGFIDAVPVGCLVGQVLRPRLAPAEGSYASQKETAVRGTSPSLRMTDLKGSLN